MAALVYATMNVPMPIAGTRDAPHFNGKYTTEFLNKIILHGRNAGHTDTDKDKLVDYIYHYSSDRIKEHIRYLPEFDIEIPGKTWNAAEKQLTTMFASSDVTTIVSEDDLKEFCRRHAEEGFLRIAAPLIKNNEITNKSRDPAFVKGIPKGLCDWFKRELPEANRTKDKPPSIETSRKILYQNFNHTNLFWDANDVKDKQSAFDDDGNRIGTSKARLTTPPASDHLNRSSVGLPSSTTVDIDALTKAMDELNLNHLRHQPNPNWAFAGAPRTGPRKCIGCGKVEGETLNHPLGMRNCPETAKLVASGEIIYNAKRRRYTLPDGSDLPYAPPGMGVADLLKATREQRNPNQRDAPPHQSVSSTMS
ncbi:hypothetical protein PQX77_011916 [Marasmius sp. AFHP31]|nr:hypothetical protein PQX77_011916 [Marasmius sp. AFHP31]